MNHINEITELLSCLVQKISGQLKGNRNWTLEIKRYLAELGANKGYLIATSGFYQEYDGEWLYDLVWYVENEKKMLISVPLVMESEWEQSLAAVKFDFEKLLLANAELRFMICQCRENQKEEYLNYFKEAILSYTFGGSADSFLIALLDTSTELFDFYVLIRNQITI